ncbi:hypothetical protein [Belliella aquatica]|uniref:Uncharacterized protein n=1 Tax=Belliella aquatica TaxID=1323734 RepID=A0ABQ1MA43_9BACT|nr:hypothetical protein [Belliella aquatica]MCH7406232.1 hypothetical protein [Belliella aquatica]GGC37196.1 hypothetical protein GCM10010993_15040 [Belliella aquatica]
MKEELSNHIKIENDFLDKFDRIDIENFLWKMLKAYAHSPEENRTYKEIADIFYFYENLLPYLLSKFDIENHNTMK